MLKTFVFNIWTRCIHTMEWCFTKSSFLGESIGLVLQNIVGSFIKNPIIAPISKPLLLPGMMQIIFFIVFSFLFHHQNNLTGFVCHYKLPVYRQGLEVLEKLSELLTE